MVAEEIRWNSGHEILWFDDNGHVREHLILWIFLIKNNLTKLNIDNYFIKILNLWIALLRKNMKLTKLSNKYKIISRYT